MVTCLGEMLNSPEYQAFESDVYGNDMFINDPERAERVYAAAEHGCNGSYHAEVIQDWRNFLNIADYSDEILEHILAEIDACEDWHEQNGSLFDTGM